MEYSSDNAGDGPPGRWHDSHVKMPNKTGPRYNGDMAADGPRSPDLREMMSEDPQEEEFDVDTILDSRTVKGSTSYRVRWKGCLPADDTWEPYENLADGAMATMQEFHRAWPRKARDKRMLLWGHISRGSMLGSRTRV